MSIPTDNNTGKLTGTRQHAPFQFDKETDSSSPYLYKAVGTGQTLHSAEIKWYCINDAGQEVEYFNIYLENVKVISVTPMMHDTRGCPGTGHRKTLHYVMKRSLGSMLMVTFNIPTLGTNELRHNK